MAEDDDAQAVVERLLLPVIDAADTPRRVAVALLRPTNPTHTPDQLGALADKYLPRLLALLDNPVTRLAGRAKSLARAVAGAGPDAAAAVIQEFRREPG
jgi:hypothetical protein